MLKSRPAFCGESQGNTYMYVSPLSESKGPNCILVVRTRGPHTDLGFRVTCKPPLFFCAVVWVLWWEGVVSPLGLILLHGAQILATPLA